MRKLKVTLLAVVATTVLSAAGSATANAGDGTLTIGTGQPCEIVFTSTGGPPSPPATGGSTISSVWEQPTDPDCFYNILPSTVFAVDFDGAGNVEANGTLAYKVPPLPSCSHPVNGATGTYNYGVGTASFGGILATGSLFCPSPSSFVLDVRNW